jgi:hypothetical protein
MAVNAGKIRIAGQGAVWRAPLGTTLPTDSTTALASGFINLGYLDEGFVDINNDVKQKEVTGFQTAEVLRIVNTAVNRKASFTAIETNNETVKMAWGGATITTTTGGAYSIAIPDSLAVSESIFVIDWQDGTTSNRVVIKRGVLSKLPKIGLKRNDKISYDFEVTPILPLDGSSVYAIYGVDSGVAS